jgi:hypothetical protein
MPGEGPIHDNHGHSGDPNLLLLTSVLHGALSAADGLRDMSMLELAELHVEAARRVVEAAEFVGMTALLTEPSFVTEGATMPEADEETVRAWHASALALLVIERTADRNSPDVVPPMSERLRRRAEQSLAVDMSRHMPDIPLLGGMARGETNNGGTQ